VGISVYFVLFRSPEAWASAPKVGLDNIFQEINQGGVIEGGHPGGSLKENSDWEASYRAALAPYKVGMLAYEGQQSLLARPDAATALFNLHVMANRDPRMGAAYTSVLRDWKANSGEMFMIYDDIYSPGKYGAWGALESFMDTVSPLSSAPPKWQAIQNFISGNDCWWTGCAGAIGSTEPPAAH
jgi:hypothetical protein